MKSSLLLLLLVVVGAAKISPPSSPSDSQDLFVDTQVIGRAVWDILPDEENCFPLYFANYLTSHITLEPRTPWGVGVFGVAMDGLDPNVTQAQFSQAVGQARRLRQLSWCVMVVVLSDDPDFLVAFAEWSLKGRLLVWVTRLLVVTRLPKEDLVALLASHWTFSMTNAMIFNVHLSGPAQRCEVYVHLPYTPDGAQVVRVASWTPAQGLVHLAPLNLFPQKYSNFHGSVLNVTVLPFEPYWKTSVEGNITTYTGMDYKLLLWMSQALNFTFHILPSNTWAEVTDQVADRTAHFTSLAYVVLPNRLERYDFTRVFYQTDVTFAMAKPVARPSWLSFYQPLRGQVWAAVLVSTLVVCVTLATITRTEMWRARHGQLSVGPLVLETVGSLLGQGLYGRLSTSRSNHILVASWLFFGVVVGTAYRGSLIAFLTLPRQPSRPETVEELVTAVDRVTYESYGSSHKAFFLKSESPTYRTLGKLMYIGVGVIDGLNDGLRMNLVSTISGRKYI